MTGVSGIAFFRTVAASAPFNRGMARSRSIKSGRDFFSLLDSVYAVNSLADYEFPMPTLKQEPNRQTHFGTVIGSQYRFSHESEFMLILSLTQ